MVKVMFDKDDFETNIIDILNINANFGKYYLDEKGNLCYKSNNGKLNEIELKGELIL